MKTEQDKLFEDLMMHLTNRCINDLEYYKIQDSKGLLDKKNWMGILKELSTGISQTIDFYNRQYDYGHEEEGDTYRRNNAHQKQTRIESTLNLGKRIGELNPVDLYSDRTVSIIKKMFFGKYLGGSLDLVCEKVEVGKAAINFLLENTLNKEFQRKFEELKK